MNVRTIVGIQQLSSPIDQSSRKTDQGHGNWNAREYKTSTARKVAADIHALLGHHNDNALYQLARDIVPAVAICR